MSEIAIAVRLEADADSAELEDATSQLRRELLELDVDDVKAPDGGEAPPGTRGAVGAAIQSWVARRASRSVKLTIDGDSIEVSNVSPEDQRELIESFLARHAPDSP